MVHLSHATMAACLVGGLLSACHGPTLPPIGPGQIVVLFQPADHPRLRQIACPEQACIYLSIEEVLQVPRAECLKAAPAAVVLSGEGKPPRYLGRMPAEIAEALACLGDPPLVIGDMCWSATTELWRPLRAGGLTPWLVVAASPIAGDGLVYLPEFSSAATASLRAAAVRGRGGEHIQRFRLTRALLDEAEEWVAATPAGRLEEALLWRLPNLVTVPLPHHGVDLIVRVPPERFPRPVMLSDPKAPWR